MQSSFQRVAFTHAIPVFSPKIILPVRHITARRPHLKPLCTRATRMTLPSAETLRASNFPTTAEQAAVILHDASVQPVAALTDTHAGLLSVLLASPHGARGLFVALLSNPGIGLADKEPLDGVLVALCVAAERGVAEVNAEGKLRQAHYLRELAIKNVVMPAAMVATYQHRGQVDLAAASAMTRDRAIRLLTAWHANESAQADVAFNPSVREVGLLMRDAVEGQDSEYSPFLKKWGYGQLELDAIRNVLHQAFGSEL